MYQWCDINNDDVEDTVDELGNEVLKIPAFEGFPYNPNCGTFACGLLITDSQKMTYAFMYSYFYESISKQDVFHIL